MIVDTDVLIDVLRGHEPALDWFAGLDQLPSVPGFVVMELIQDADRNERIDKAMKLVEPLPVVWPTAGECEGALELFRAYHLSHGLGLLDSLIASCAIGRSTSLLTFNHKHYRCVPDLELLAPYER